MIYNQQPKTMAEYNFVAVDLGATSGRVILATFGGEGEDGGDTPFPIAYNSDVWTFLLGSSCNISIGAERLEDGCRARH